MQANLPSFVTSYKARKFRLNLEIIRVQQNSRSTSGMMNNDVNL